MKFSTDDIKNDDAIIDFLNSRPLAESTIRNYIVRLKGYSNFLEMSPTEIIEEAEKEQDDPTIRIKKRKIKKHLNGYVRFMEKEKSPITVHRTLTDLKTFYIHHEIDPPKIITKKQPKTSIENLPKMDEIKKAVRSTKNSRDKALLLLHLSSGMGAYEVRHLKYTDFLNAIGAPKETKIDQLRDFVTDTTVPTWHIRRGKTGSPFFTYSTPESTLAILDYLEDRGYECEYLFTADGCNRLLENAHHDIFRRINDKCNFGLQENGKHRKFTSHQLRRCFGTYLLRARLDKDKIDFMLGHEDTRTRAAYFKEDPDFLKQEYMKAMQAVSLEKLKMRFVTDERLLKMENEIESLKAELKKVQKEKVEDVKSDFNQTPQPD